MSLFLMVCLDQAPLIFSREKQETVLLQRAKLNIKSGCGFIPMLANQMEEGY